MALENRDTVAQDNSDFQYQEALKMSPADRNALLQKLKRQRLITTLGSVGQSALTGAKDFFMGRKSIGFHPQTGAPMEVGGETPKAASSLDELIAYEKLKTIQRDAEKRDLELAEAKRVAEYQAQLRKEKETADGGIVTQPETITPQVMPQEEGITPIQTVVPAGMTKAPIPTQVPTTRLAEQEPSKWTYEYKTDSKGNVTKERAISDEWKTWNELRGKRETKRQEMDVKKEQLRDDLQSFFAVDDLIDRAKGGIIDLKSAAFNTWWKSIDQPVDPITGRPDPKGAAAATHAAASKRLRVQLVRAAGDVGNINIVEQEAAEKLIPRWDDSETTATLKRAYLRQIAKAVNSGSENEVKKVLRNIGIGFETRGEQEVADNIPTGQDNEYQRYLQLIGGR